MSYPKRFLELLKPALDESPQQKYKYEFPYLYLATYYPLYRLFIVEHIDLETMEMHQFLSHMEAYDYIREMGFTPCQ